MCVCISTGGPTPDHHIHPSIQRLNSCLQPPPVPDATRAAANTSMDGSADGATCGRAGVGCAAVLITDRQNSHRENEYIYRNTYMHAPFPSLSIGVCGTCRKAHTATQAPNTHPGQAKRAAATHREKERERERERKRERGKGATRITHQPATHPSPSGSYHGTHCTHALPLRVSIPRQADGFRSWLSRPTGWAGELHT